MKTNLAALLSSTAMLFSFGAAQAAPPVNQSSVNRAEVQSYAELLEPIPNALEKLRVDDMQPPPRARLIPARFHHHHHHHHHYHHHHHHHHGFGAGAFIGGLLGGILAAPAPDCYWTLGRPYWNGYRWVRRRVQVCR